MDYTRNYQVKYSINSSGLHSIDIEARDFSVAVTNARKFIGELRNVDNANIYCPADEKWYAIKSAGADVSITEKRPAVDLDSIVLVA